MPVSPSFSEAVLELFAFAPDVRVRRMFGGAGVFSGEMMFALIDDDELYLKADETTRPLFEAEGCEAWTYSLRGESQQRDLGYRRAPEAVWDDPDEARRWGALALEAAARKFKPKTRKDRG